MSGPKILLDARSRVRLTKLPRAIDKEEAIQEAAADALAKGIDPTLTPITDDLMWNAIRRLSTDYRDDAKELPADKRMGTVGEAVDPALPTLDQGAPSDSGRSKAEPEDRKLSALDKHREMSLNTIGAGKETCGCGTGCYKRQYWRPVRLPERLPANPDSDDAELATALRATDWRKLERANDAHSAAPLPAEFFKFGPLLAAFFWGARDVK